MPSLNPDLTGGVTPSRVRVLVASPSRYNNVIIELYIDDDCVGALTEEIVGVPRLEVGPGANEFDPQLFAAVLDLGLKRLDELNANHD